MSRVETLMRDLTAAIREEVGALPQNVATLGEEVLRARTEARLSLQEVAERSGFTKSHVWEIEKGRARNPTIGMVAGLSKALGIPFLRLAQAALNSTEASSIPETSTRERGDARADRARGGGREPLLGRAAGAQNQKGPTAISGEPGQGAA